MWYILFNFVRAHINMNIRDFNFQTNTFFSSIDSCSIQNVMKTTINHCRNDYNWYDDNTAAYKPFWKEASEAEQEELDKSKTDPFVYQNSYRSGFTFDYIVYCASKIEHSTILYTRSLCVSVFLLLMYLYIRLMYLYIRLKNMPYPATLTTYKGGGYVFNFERSYRRTKRNLTRLREEDWLDLTTRAIFLEFTVYNPNANLFASAIMVSEFPSWGGAIHRTEFKVGNCQCHLDIGVLLIYLV